MKKRFLFILFSLWTSFAGFSQTATNVGTDFWIAFPPNMSSLTTLSIFISSDFFTSGSITSAYPGVNQNFTVTPGIVTQLSVPSDIRLLPGVENKGIHIISNSPISVYGLNWNSASTDAYLALPTSSLGKDYIVLTYVVSWANMGSGFSVIAVQNGTILTVFNHQTTNTNIVNLDAGQTYMEEGGAVGDDLTGSTIQSNFPVVVYGSGRCVNIPAECGWGDHIIEQIPPTNAWGKKFITVPLAGRDASGDIFRILAKEDGTNISINGTSVTTINAREFYETNLAGSSSIITNKAVLLAQYAKGITCSGGLTGDPFMMLVPPREQFITSYTICTLAGFTSHWVNLVVPSYAIGTIYKDGVLIPSSAFTPVGTTSFYGAQIPITEGSHTFSSTSPFGVFIYGWTNINSYGYPGGSSLSPIATINSVTLSPETASGILNVSTLCFTAHVEDDFSNPVAGILVNFNISGISNITATAYTDASGNAQYCYARTGATTGTDNVYAECFGINSTTSTAIWTTTALCINPTSGGSIGNSQTGCGSFTPDPLTSLTLPSGQSGTLEYKWQQSVTSAVAGYNDIPGSNSPGYSPGPISQTTWFRRVARVNCMSDWTGAAITNTLELTVTAPVIPAVTISADFEFACEGQSVTFTAIPANGGSSPIYQWRVNSSNINNAINAIFTYAPMDGDQVSCVLTSNLPCLENNPATSNTITMIVDPVLPVNVTISTPANPVCAGTPVTFSAFPVNAGTMPEYQWKVNTINAIDANNAIFTYTPMDGDEVQCVLTSSDIICLSNNPATSNLITMAVNPLQPVSVVASPSVNPVCSGMPVTFTTFLTHGGVMPAYQWKVNASNANNANNANFTYTPLDGDVVTCEVTSSDACVSGNPAMSNPVTMVVNASLVAGITIAPSVNPFCPGSAVTFTASPINGGTMPAYQWKVNAINVSNPNNAIYTYIAEDGDNVSCSMTSNLDCVTGNPANSNTIVLNGTLAPDVSFQTCFDTITTVNAKPFKLMGGIPLGGTYSGPGVNSLTGIFNPSVAGAGLKSIVYTCTNSVLCSSGKTKTIMVHPNTSFICGNILTDIRDNKTYPTAQIGSQCWMQANLDFGYAISDLAPQTDNCMVEKYIRASFPYSAFYQWDEMMKYDGTQAGQGVCPPGWHVPSESDWTALFDHYQGNGRAGTPLQDSLLNEFNALHSGVFYANTSWSFMDFATLFWSSTSWGQFKALSHGMNLYNFSVSCYPSNRANAFPVRCLKD